jgi:integrase-like protein
MQRDSTNRRQLLGFEPNEASPSRAIVAGADSVRRRIGIAEAGRRYITNREMIGLKPSTLSDYESCLRVHLIPFFGSRALDDIDVDLVDLFIADKRAEGKAPKSIRNYLGLAGWRDCSLCMAPPPIDTRRERSVHRLRCRKRPT